MKNLIKVVFLCLVAQGAWGATGTAGVETFYVRPAADCANNGDGLAYACAASAGASGAWRTSASVVWTTTTGVDDGDTLKYCGSFVEADLDTGAYFIFLAGTVTGANEAGRITITGDCSSEGGAAQATVTGSATMNNFVGLSTSDYITVDSFDVTGFERVVLNSCSPASDPDAPIYRDISAAGIESFDGSAAMQIVGINYLVEDVSIEAVGEPIFICNGSSNLTYGTVRRAILTTTSTTDLNADGIQAESGGSGITAEDITVYKANPDKGCALFGSAIGAVKVENFQCFYTGNRSILVNGVVVDGSATGGYVRRVWSNATNHTVYLRDDVTAFAGTFDVSSIVAAGSRRFVSLEGTHAAGVFTVSNVSGWSESATGVGIYMLDPFDPLSATFRNLAIDAPTGVGVSASTPAADVDIDYVRWGPNVADWKWRGTTDTTLAAYKTTSGKGANDTQGDIKWVAGPSPTTSEGFQLKADSPLLCAGTFLGRYPDHGGGFVFKQGCVDIGAWATSQRTRTDTSSIRTDTTSIREQ